MIKTNTHQVGEPEDGREKSPVETLVAERGKTHGDYRHHADITQALKKAFWEGTHEAGKHIEDDFTNMQAEAISMIFHKLGRIGAGDPNFRDHWDDIAGYAHLVAERL